MYRTWWAQKFIRVKKIWQMATGLDIMKTKKAVASSVCHEPLQT